MKKELMRVNALVANFCADKYNPNQDSLNDEQYINTNNNKWAHYTYEPKATTHAITIIGWDDDFQKEDFLNKQLS